MIIELEKRFLCCTTNMLHVAGFGLNAASLHVNFFFFLSTSVKSNVNPVIVFSNKTIYSRPILMDKIKVSAFITANVILFLIFMFFLSFIFPLRLRKK